MNDPMLSLPGLSSASGIPVVAKFDGGLLSSDGGVLALREVEQRLRVADRLAPVARHLKRLFLTFCARQKLEIANEH